MPGMIKIRKFNFLSILSFTVGIYFILVVLLFTGIIDEYNGQLLTLAGIYIIVSLSVNLITGFTGQLVLGQAGFMCIGAYATAITVMKFNVPLIFAFIIGGLVTAVFGLIIGFPTLRLRGDYLAITTLGFGEIVRVIMVNLESLTGGAAGLKGIPQFSATGNFIWDEIIKFSWVFLFVVLTAALISNLIKSSHGRSLISIREDEIAANSMGINVFYYKMFSFTLSAFIAGLGGGLYAIYFGYLNPVMFGFINSVNFVIIPVLGGLGSITGTILSGVAYTFILEWFRIFGDFRLVIFPIALIAVMLFWPKGLLGSSELSIVRSARKLLIGEYTVQNIKSQVDGFIKKHKKK